MIWHLQSNAASFALDQLCCSPPTSLPLKSTTVLAASHRTDPQIAASTLLKNPNPHLAAAEEHHGVGRVGAEPRDGAQRAGARAREASYLVKLPLGLGLGEGRGVLRRGLDAGGQAAGA